MMHSIIAITFPKHYPPPIQVGMHQYLPNLFGNLLSTGYSIGTEAVNSIIVCFCLDSRARLSNCALRFPSYIDDIARKKGVRAYIEKAFIR